MEQAGAQLDGVELVRGVARRRGARVPGRVTVEDVALEAGVSKTTAASILREAPNFQVSEATRHRVLEAARALGYRRHAVAVALSSGRTNTVGLLLPLAAIDARMPTSRIYGQDIFVAVFQAASRAGLRVTAIPLPHADNPHLPLQDLTDRSVDGIVMASVPSAEFVREVYQSGIPCVEIGSGHGRHLIHPDNEGGIEAAVAHLVALGHRRIVHWRGAGDNYASVHRHKGFAAASERHKLPATSTWVVRAQEEITALLRLPPIQRPTAVVAYNDYQACLALDIAREIGLRVPDDLSVVGFDDNILAEAARPQLSTIRNSLSVQAEAAITLLQALCRGEEPESPAPVPTQLIIRHSTGPAPSSGRGAFSPC